MAGAHPELLTDVEFVSMARAMSLPLPKFWLVKPSDVKLLPTTTSLLVEDNTALSGPATVTVMTLPAVIFAAARPFS